MNPIFSISDLKCSYNNGKRVVLEIDKLDIPYGIITFIIGSSGIGKSTILETFGMMNNTIVKSPDTRFIFYDNNAGCDVDLIDLWRKKDKILSKFRSSHFSFIFQNTNLMENLTTCENVDITQLIQGKTFFQARRKTENILKTIGLGGVEGKQHINLLSGGQRQRLAFARAIAADFTVLFGDEPTGNLDLSNAMNLMDVLHENIKSHGRSAIIVSHDIDLALKYADLIIFISKAYRSDQDGNIHADEEAYGRINEHSMFFKNADGPWANNGRTFKVEALKQYLITELHQTTISEPRVNYAIQ
jgi:putative ABC transport system ATP-binding protein